MSKIEQIIEILKAAGFEYNESWDEWRRGSDRYIIDEAGCMAWDEDYEEHYGIDEDWLIENYK
jgi:hypothetical protein